jgi:hypothetical protein
MHYILYKTTNTISGRFYIGVHETDNLNDGYLGSGEYLKNAIKKYGVENFTCVILETYEDKKFAFEEENEIVNETFIRRLDTYNLRVGGGGFGSRAAASAAATIKNRMYPGDPTIARVVYDEKRINDPEFNEKVLKQISELGKNPIKIAERSATFKESGHGVGEKNSQYGKRWVHHIIHGKKQVQHTELDQYLSKGWVRGKGIRNFYEEAL